MLGCIQLHQLRQPMYGRAKHTEMGTRDGMLAAGTLPK